MCVFPRDQILTLSSNNKNGSGSRLLTHGENCQKKEGGKNQTRHVLFFSNKVVFSKKKKEEKNLRCTVNAFSFFPLNLYTVDLTLRPCRKIGRAENRRYFRLSKQQLEIFVGNKETLVSFNVTRCRFIID